MRLPLLCLFALLLLLGPVRAAEPFFKKGDVIALVGGEDMVVASEYGYLELLLTRALPDYHLRFRNLAWEGDTVFEQRRDLNFPTYEEQLDKIGATVVIAQFGQMESLAGKEKLPEFIAAYEKLIERFSAGGKRRVVIWPPSLFAPGSQQWDGGIKYAEATKQMAGRLKLPFSSLYRFFDSFAPAYLRDGVHYTAQAHYQVALQSYSEFIADSDRWAQRAGLIVDSENHMAGIGAKGESITAPALEPLRQLIIAKNRLWFDYWRPQNWAFLAGDRTAQPSSRDHLDPSKRWFPPEREAFLPLIEAKEKEIDALAAQLAAANAGK